MKNTCSELHHAQKFTCVLCDMLIYRESVIANITGTSEGPYTRK